MHFQCGKAFQEKHKRKIQGHCWVSVGIQLGSGTHSLIMPFLTQYPAQSKHLILFTLSSYPGCDHWVIVYILLNNLSVVLNNKCCDDCLCSYIFFLHKFPQKLIFGGGVNHLPDPPFRNGLLTRAMETLAALSNDGAHFPQIKTEFFN